MSDIQCQFLDLYVNLLSFEKSPSLNLPCQKPVDLTVSYFGISVPFISPQTRPATGSQTPAISLTERYELARKNSTFDDVEVPSTQNV
jgi:hypothetical protein